MRRRHRRRRCPHPAPHPGHRRQHRQDAPVPVPVPRHRQRARRPTGNRTTAVARACSTPGSAACASARTRRESSSGCCRAAMCSTSVASTSGCSKTRHAPTAARAWCSHSSSSSSSSVAAWQRWPPAYLRGRRAVAPPWPRVGRLRPPRPGRRRAAASAGMLGQRCKWVEQMRRSAPRRLMWRWPAGWMPRRCIQTRWMRMRV
mmetsp:Transcript_6002/g.18523  ORF Transcript_6002/g.18523 Transcript_6002/m.18523 type:complete len:203 (-) Transcript_6002:813-1421(-)